MRVCFLQTTLIYHLIISIQRMLKYVKKKKNPDKMACPNDRETQYNKGSSLIAL